MSDLILHHYPQSPFAEKARLMLGFKGLSWQSVMIPSMMPKPDLNALTGGYRRTPVMQVGADIYCDTAMIARRLEQEKAAPALFPEGREAAAMGLAQFADQVLFQHGVAINFQPKGLAARFAGMPEQVIKGFMADRKALFEKGSASRLDPAVALSQWPTLLSRLETQLQRDGAFLLGDTPCIADFSHYHPLWFVSSNKAVAEALEGYPAVTSWMQRMADIGHGVASELSADEAISIAKQATPAALPDNAIASPGGFSNGQAVTVSAVDYGTDQVAGTLLFEGAEEIIIAREDERAGLVHVHFPRYGYRIAAA
ncbi:MAG TPA: glutathione S-transferase family protein [Pseudomonas sabulinigri]|uniref:GST N-terminal domain-containing protein n=1 Tax=marine sediment metagenome TaxID=412755 RepID=A0A0F9WQH0_9ZZZZ|nr:glutathione S-transferase family protein [Halopseudomonas sabulinigri]HEC52926.1 glutathione S-transferase family protein [Halopseudomonas sabulinigri]|tara:strand:- start:4494 stop:5429 length:936 start_codon:yes stop_codon:yes gene_type:complete